MIAEINKIKGILEARQMYGESDAMIDALGDEHARQHVQNMALRGALYFAEGHTNAEECMAQAEQKTPYIRTLRAEIVVLTKSDLSTLLASLDKIKDSMLPKPME